MTEPESTAKEETLQEIEPKSNQKADPASAFGLLALAYSKKGKTVAVTKKAIQAACKKTDLDDQARSHLFELADADCLLAVPRQIVMLASMVSRHTDLFRTLMEFVREVLSRHPAFSIRDLTEVLSRAPDAPGLVSALELIADADLSKIRDPKSGKSLTSKQLLDLRINAAHALVAWLALEEEMDVENVALALFTALWKPAAREVTGELERLMCLIECRDLTSIGIACAAFQSRTGKQMRLVQEAQESESAAIERADRVQRELDRALDELATASMRVQELEGQLSEQHRRHEVEVSHLGDDLESLRARLTRRLRDETELLREGLHALRRDPPLVRVTDDHVERAINGLEDALQNLEART